MWDFLGNLLGALLGTGLAFYLGTISEKKSRNNQQKEKLKRLKNEISRSIYVMSDTDLSPAHFIVNAPKIGILVKDMQSKFNEIESSNNTFADELIISNCSFEGQQESWLEFRNQYISKFMSSCEKYFNSVNRSKSIKDPVESKKIVDESATALCGAKKNLNKKLDKYLESLKFIDNL